MITPLDWLMIFFKCGITDIVEYPIGGGWVKCKSYEWTLTDLDGALYEMEKVK